METGILDLMWMSLQAQIDNLRVDVAAARKLSERAETAGGIGTSTLNDAPLVADGGVRNGDLLFITNGRKTGEGAGSGTGIPAYYDANSNTWRRFYDDATVTT